MLLINMCIVGGVLYTGLKTLVKRRSRRKALWLARLGNQAPRDGQPAMGENCLDLSGPQTVRYFMLASVSLGLSMPGALVYPPLSLVSVPLNVYTSLPVFEQAYAALLYEGRLTASAFWSTTIVGTLATQHYFLASLINWLYFFLDLPAKWGYSVKGVAGIHHVKIGFEHRVGYHTPCKPIPTLVVED